MENLESQLMSNKEAAHYLGVTEQMLRLSRHKKELFKGVQAPQYLKLGTAVRYRKDELDRWLNQFKQYKTTAEAKADLNDSDSNLG